MVLLNSIKETLILMLSLTFLYFIFSMSNVIFGTFYNMKKGDPFSWKRFWSGIGKSIALLCGVLLTSIGSTMIPAMNEELINATGKELMNAEFIEYFSTTILYVSIIAGIGIQATKAFANVSRLFKSEIKVDELAELTKRLDEENLSIESL